VGGVRKAEFATFENRGQRGMGVKGEEVIGENWLNGGGSAKNKKKPVLKKLVGGRGSCFVQGSTWAEGSVQKGRRKNGGFGDNLQGVTEAKSPCNAERGDVQKKTTGLGPGRYGGYEKCPWETRVSTVQRKTVNGSWGEVGGDRTTAKQLQGTVGGGVLGRNRSQSKEGTTTRHCLGVTWRETL